MGERPGSELRAMIARNDRRTWLGVAVVDRHAQRIGDQRGGLVVSIDQLTTQRENTSSTTQQ
jgi:hypothetical protein